MKKPLALGAVAAMLAFGITSAQQPVRVGIAFDAGGKNDRSFNQSAFEGAQRAAKAFGVEVKTSSHLTQAKSVRASATSPRAALTW